MTKKKQKQKVSLEGKKKKMVSQSQDNCHLLSSFMCLD